MSVSWTPFAVDAIVLSLLVATAFVIVRERRLFSLVLLTCIYSFLGAIWMTVLDAPDVAFTEAAVGAGIATVLFLLTMSLTGRTSRLPRPGWMPLGLVVLTGATLIYGTLDMPHYGDPEAPIHTHVSGDYLEMTEHDIHIPNVVTAVLASYRGYDTLGETTVILTAGIAVLLLLQTARRRPMGGFRGLTGDSILRVVSKVLIPYILLYALYVQFHGDFGPGGGFQAGVIFASALILYGVVFGLTPLQNVVRPWFVEAGAALGVILFAGVGFASMLLGGNFLDYGVFDSHDPAHGQHLGILLVEIGVGITVTSVMLVIFYAFAGRGRRST